MKKVKIFMALALLAFFGLYVYTNCTCYTSADEPDFATVQMTEIKSKTKAVFVNNSSPEVKTKNNIPDPIQAAVNVSNNKTVKQNTTTTKVDIKPIPDYLEKGIKWLADAQFENGGWGAGLSSQQNIRDPKSVNIDPATTAFSAMALMNTGDYQDNIKRALMLLLEMTEKSADDSKNITDIRGTQPQNKLGANIDLSMTTQFFARAIEQLKNKKLKKRTKAALEKCLAKIEKSQHADGSFNDQGWAPVLQSAMANNALEMSYNVDGVKVNKETLRKSKKYQQANVSFTGSVATDKAAGVKLYAYSSAQRATAEDAKRVTDALGGNADFNKIEEETEVVSPEALDEVIVMLEDKGVEKEEAKDIANAYMKNRVATTQLQSEAVLSGFGNNGGEEYLSYMMTSESMVESGDKAWTDWHQKMETRLGKVQNGNGSWSGHHCITSPVFCTAAVIMTLTADRK